MTPGKNFFQKRTFMAALLGAMAAALSTIAATTPAPAPQAPPAPRPPIATPIPHATTTPVATPVPTAGKIDPRMLVVDAEEKIYQAKVGETNAPFVFTLTNVGSAEIVVHSVRTSCGCTLAKLPAQPWHLPGGASGSFEVNMDLRGKSGLLAKTVSIDSTAGFKMLMVKANIAAGQAGHGGGENMNRQLNMQMAMADRQVIFKGDCASCHVTPAKGKRGKELYDAACGICHDAEHRASMVPDLKALKTPTSYEYWKLITTHGKPNTLMPAFAAEYGGFLNGDEITSIAEYLARAIPPKTAQPQPETPVKKAGVPPPGAPAFQRAANAAPPAPPGLPQ